jgi:hypothetical protein
MKGETGAIFSDCRRYRYRLWRRWAPGDTALFLLMNPSTADEVKNDATVERCVRRATRWNIAGMGIGCVEVCNVFAWRETDSRKLLPLIAQGVDIIGPENDAAISMAAKGAKLVICGWGMPGNLMGRGAAVLKMLRATGIEPHALGLNSDGTPKHPLYIGYSVDPVKVP